MQKIQGRILDNWNRVPDVALKESGRCALSWYDNKIAVQSAFCSRESLRLKS
jgi:hypothetical protein